jgi:heat shock protein HslJ
MKAGRLTIALLVLLAATGCGDRGTPAGPGGQGAGGPEPDVRGRTFLSVSASKDGESLALLSGTRIRLQFTDDGRLIADAGCNMMQGPVSLAGGRLELADMSITDMGCDRPRHDQDSWLAEFLQGRPSVRVDGADLVVASPDTELVMRDKEIAEPDLALEGTRWVVDMLVEGEVASSTPAGTEATLVFEPDRVLVSTGCNSGSGGYTVSGNTIRFGPVATTRKACEPALMSLESAVLGVLDGEVAYSVDSRRLTLKHPSGKALQLAGRPA